MFCIILGYRLLSISNIIFLPVDLSKLIVLFQHSFHIFFLISLKNSSAGANSGK